MSSNLSWGNVPTVSANQQRAKSVVKRQALKEPSGMHSTLFASSSSGTSPSMATSSSMESSSLRPSDSVEEFVLRVTSLSKQVEQYKQLSNQRAQQVAFGNDYYNNNSSSANNSNNNNNNTSSDLRGNSDVTKKIRFLRQHCTSEVNELKKISNRIGSKIGNESIRMLMESGTINSNTESNSSNMNSQHETSVKYNRVKNDLARTICVLKDVIRRDKEWIAQQTKQKQEQYALHQLNGASSSMMLGNRASGDMYDEEDELEGTSEDHPLLSKNKPQQSQQQQQLQELQLKEEGTLVSWQESTLNVEMKIAMEEYEDLKNYQSEYYELNHLFKEFATLVDEQDPMLDSIHTNVITSKDNVERGVENLKESNKLRKTGSKVMWIVMGLVLLTVLGVGLVVIFGKGVIW